MLVGVGGVKSLSAPSRTSGGVVGALDCCVFSERLSGLCGESINGISGRAVTGGKQFNPIIATQLPMGTKTSDLRVLKLLFIYIFELDAPFIRYFLCFK